MEIVQVNDCDLMGRKFNGYDLQLSLNKMGYNANQLVLKKLGKDLNTFAIASESELFIRSILKNLEYKLSTANLLYPFGKSLAYNPMFQNADIVHYHLVHNHFLSLLDFLKLTKNKPSVWTIHDPWIVTGHCIYPMECGKWKNGCIGCPKLDDIVLPMQIDKASQMWKIKKEAYKEINIDIIVASEFSEGYIKNSPLTAHLKRVHRIPFGIDVESFANIDKGKAREKWRVPEGNFVISFRAEESEVKGLKYIVEMLSKIKSNIPITLVTVGNKKLPKYLSDRYQIIEFGWSNDLDVLYDFYGMSDVFVMPSLVESFGLMAIEAMAAGCPIIVFENTVLPEITFAPECGIAVPYKDSDMLRAAIEQLIHNPKECRWRGEKGKELASRYYRYEDYIKRHIALYEEISSRKGEI